ncbi:MAG: hypothetical protein LBI87_05275 [Candidatus Accumulibacter sp.]|jgi:hypothetical protein|nr:hypothetical protein [Accumulibacter sp.]
MSSIYSRKRNRSRIKNATVPKATEAVKEIQTVRVAAVKSTQPVKRRQLKAVWPVKVPIATLRAGRKRKKVASKKTPKAPPPPFKDISDISDDAVRTEMEVWKAVNDHRFTPNLFDPPNRNPAPQESRPTVREMVLPKSRTMSRFLDRKIKVVPHYEWFRDFDPIRSK